MSDLGASGPDRLPSDDQMDHLLKSFFRQEITDAFSAERFVVRRTPSPLIDGNPVRHRHSASTGFTMVATMVTVAAFVLMITGVNNHFRSTPEGSGTGNVVQDGTNPAAPSEIKASSGDDQHLMLVSPGADRPDTATGILGNNGVTLEETENVDLNPLSETEKPR